MSKLEEGKDLFGNDPPDPFATARERYGVWPTTVWEVDCQDRTTQELKERIGDGGEVRQLANRPLSYKKTMGTGEDTDPSIFNPAVCEWALNLYGKHLKPGAWVLDPFAGGGTRAILCAKRGWHYDGVELREDEARAIVERCRQNNIDAFASDQLTGLTLGTDLAGLPPETTGTVRLYVNDARVGIPLDKTYDLLITCPPYWTLEQYSVDPRDLSSPTTTYTDYIEALRMVVAQTAQVLKPGAPSLWVVGLCRSSDGGLKAIHHDLAKIHKERGFAHREEIILSVKNNGALRRVGNVERGKGHLIRTHEYLLVFRR